MTYLPPTIPAVRCYNSGNQSISASTSTALTFDSNRFDVGTGTAQHSTSSNTSRLVCQVAGVYHMAGTIQFAVVNTTGVRDVYLRVNGSTYIAALSAPAGTTGAADNAYRAVSAVYQLAVSDYVELIAYQTSSVSLNVVASGNFSPEFWMVRLG